MPQITSEVIGITTPAKTITFTPNNIQGNIASYLDTTGGVSLGFPRLSVSLTRPSKGSKYTRIRARMVVPEMEPVAVEGEAPVLAYENFADITFTFHERSNSDQRSIMRQAMMMWLDEANPIVVLEDLENLY